ncbi:hypothetical protein PRZ48_003916 [Zasmidium cellare]|uniref:Uncharacterized protein n=1 Tax=Zasmidium cellare TaxID=395010 RepID=A0ABR0EWE6_ZASCE|nr:hypothetical protein PRZ48_003916 [Zasmidium cellare]
MERFTYDMPDDAEIQHLMANQDLLGDTLTLPSFDSLPFAGDVDLGDLFHDDFEDIDTPLAQSSDRITPTIQSTVTSNPESTDSRAHAWALQVGDPTPRTSEEFLPLIKDPSVELIPRDRSFRQYGAELYPFGPRALGKNAATSNNEGQTIQRQSFSPPNSTQVQIANQFQQASTTGASKKRKASNPLGGVFKISKTSKLPKTASNTSSPNNIISSTADSNATMSKTTASNSRITSSMSQHAPQAYAANRNILPPPAPDDQHATPNGSFSEYAASTDSYGQHTLGRPPPNVCLPLDVELGIVELMTFFPNSAQIPQLGIRLMRNGFSYQTLAKMELDPVNELTDKNAKTAEGKIKWQFKDAGECEWPHKKAKRTMWQQIAKGEGPHHDLTANHYQLRHEYANKKKGQAGWWGHWKLRDIYGAVDPSKWPKEDDRMVLTQCLEFARDNPQLDLDTSHWDWIIQLINPQQPAFPTGYITRDAEVLFRFSALYPTAMVMRRARAAAKRANK